jgi:hypothetical protein
MAKTKTKDEKKSGAVRRAGNSEQKSTAKGSRRPVATKGSSSRAYENWKKDDLVRRARELGIAGRSTMNKEQLITALRHH